MGMGSVNASASKTEKTQCEVLVIGAGLIGSSVAMHLSKLGVSGVRVVDFDLEGTFSSSELNAGGVRATWIQPINIAVSKVSIDYFSEHAEDVGYRACGYLWLHKPENLPAALKARDLQISMGWPVEAWDVPTLQRKISFIDKTEGIAGAVFAPRDGLVNPNLLKMHYRKKAVQSGAVFEDRVWVQSVEREASGVRVRGLRFMQPLSSEQKLVVFSGGMPGDLPPGAAVEFEIHAERLVNCAGPWAAGLAKMLKYECPSLAVRRQISIFDCRDADLTPYGMIVDTSGVYFHPEATNGLAGFGGAPEAPGVNFNYDGEAFFMEYIWSALYERSSAFERLKHLTGWAGLYETSPDESAIIGEALGGQGKIFEAHSFSGHGAMHSYGAGLALAEKMVFGEYRTLDLSPLSAERFGKNQLIHETLII